VEGPPVEPVDAEPPVPVETPVPVPLPVAVLLPVGLPDVDVVVVGEVPLDAVAPPLPDVPTTASVEHAAAPSAHESIADAKRECGRTLGGKVLSCLCPNVAS
jgi:hypothetical protein